LIRPETAFFHRCKDGSLSRMLLSGLKRKGVEADVAGAVEGADHVQPPISRKPFPAVHVLAEPERTPQKSAPSTDEREGEARESTQEGSPPPVSPETDSRGGREIPLSGGVESRHADGEGQHLSNTDPSMRKQVGENNSPPKTATAEVKVGSESSASPAQNFSKLLEEYEQSGGLTPRKRAPRKMKRKKRTLSPEHRAKLIANIAKAREAKSKCQNPPSSPSEETGT